MSKKGIVRKFTIKSIRSKLLLSYLIAIAIPVFTLGVYSMKLLDQSLREHSLTAEKEELYQLTENIKYQLNSCIDLSDNICFDSKIWEYFYHQYSYPTISTEGYYNLIRPIFTRFLALKKEISKITVFTENDTLLFNNFEIANIEQGTPEEELYKETVESQKTLWKVLVDDKTNKGTILMTRMLNLNNVNVGMLVVYINEDQLYNAIRVQMDCSNTYLLNSEGVIITSTDRDAIGKGETYFNCDTQINDGSMIVREMDTNDGLVRLTGLDFELGGLKGEQWKIIRTVPMSSVLSASSETKAYQVTGFILLIVLLVLISTLLSNGIAGRIKDLAGKMKKVEQGQFDVSVEFSGHDEIAYLGNSFNTMVEKLDKLVKQVYQMQIIQKDLELKSKEAQLNMLQSQINPHFLFNTLDALLYGIENNKKESRKIVELLARYFRRSIKWDDDFVSVDEEVIFIEEYLTIQQFRMQDKLEWHIETSNEALKYKMPKMLIQPLIENAVYHGLSLKKEKGSLYLLVEASDNYLIITVRDDGVGIEEYRLEEIKRVIDSSNDEDVREIDAHVGLKNVNDRISLYYGELGSFMIHSEFQKGTTVEIRLPI